MISNLDLLRSKFLKQTLQISALDSIFHSRPLRLFVLASLALVFYFLISLYFPLWVLLIGPVLWGVPHLISSLRYNTLLASDLTQKKKFFYFQSLIWFLVFTYRLCVDVFQISLFLSEHYLLFESLALIISFSAQVWLFKRLTLMSLLYFGLFSGLVAATHFYPVMVGLALLIGHNYIPLWTWFQSCQNQKDLRVFYIVSFVYLLFSSLILSGVQNWFYRWASPQASIGFLNWNFMNIVEPFGAREEHAPFWFRIVSLYAFSQAIHYFMWLKAIPENYQRQQFPPSFRWSLHKLSSDFGSTSLLLLLILVLAGAGYWFFFEYQMARVIYFSLASYHGFMEISCLPFFKSNRSL